MAWVSAIDPTVAIGAIHILFSLAPSESLIWDYILLMFGCRKEVQKQQACILATTGTGHV